MRQRERETGEACEPLTGCERADEREGARGRGATISESFKPVIGLGDARQDVEEMLCPRHGLLQAEAELAAAERHLLHSYVRNVTLEGFYLQKEERWALSCIVTQP